MGFKSWLFGATTELTAENGMKLNDGDRCRQLKLRADVEARIIVAQDQLSVLLGNMNDAAAGRWHNSQAEVGMFEAQIGGKLEEIDKLEDQWYQIAETLSDLRTERLAFIEAKHAPMQEAAVDDGS